MIPAIEAVPTTLLRFGDCGGEVGRDIVPPDPAATRLRFPTLKIFASCCCQLRYLAIFFVMYDFPLAGRPTMTTTSFAPTSRCEILPSGDTRDRVIPGMFSVVAGGLTRGVVEPEFCRTGGL